MKDATNSTYKNFSELYDSLVYTFLSNIGNMFEEELSDYFDFSGKIKKYVEMS